MKTDGAVIGIVVQITALREWERHRRADLRRDGKDFAMKRQFNVIIERDAAGYYVGSVPGLAGCYTQAKSLDVLMKRVREAIDLCIEEGLGSSSNEFVGVQQLTVEA